MKLGKGTVLVAAAALSLGLLTSSSAVAHSFAVALVVPQANPLSDKSREIIKGFLFAATQRDAHPDQESDGHLGGLDVYVTVIDGRGDITHAMAAAAPEGRVDMVAAFGPEAMLSQVRERLKESQAVLLPPGQSPFSVKGHPGVAAFVSAYKKAYGVAPSLDAARGYNAARRIAFAVRKQDGIDDRADLIRVLAETAQGFTWQAW